MYLNVYLRANSENMVTGMCQSLIHHAQGGEVKLVMMFRAMDVVMSHSSLLRVLNCVSVSCSETLLIGQGFQVSQWGVNVKWHELSEAIGPKGLESAHPVAHP